MTPEQRGVLSSDEKDLWDVTYALAFSNLQTDRNNFNNSQDASEAAFVADQAVVQRRNLVDKSYT